MTETKKKMFKVLIIDDDPDICESIKCYLEADGRFRVLVAHGGNIGTWIASCKWHRPNLILLDIKMPGQDGFHVLEKLRSIRPTKYTPIIMLTAFSDPAFKIKAGGLYCDGYILKSEPIEVLKAKIEEVLKNRGLLED